VTERISTVQESEWHLDKRVPVALIAGMIGQVGVAVWFGAMLFRDVEANTLGLAISQQEYRAGFEDMQGRITAFERSAGVQAVQMSRVATQIESQGKTLERIDSALSELTRYLREGR